MEDARRFDVVTNNPEVRRLLGTAGEGVHVRFVPGTPLDVFDEAALLLQQGYRLVSAPLPPNIPMMRAPWRSLLVERADRQYDVPGLLALEKARATLAAQRAVDAPEDRVGDFARMDVELLRRAHGDARIEEALQEEGATQSAP